MEYSQLINDEKQYVMQTYGRFGLALDHGKGCYLYDLDGNEYLDLTSGIGVNCLGHAHEQLTNALQAQVGKLMHVSNLYYTEPMVTAAKILCRSTGMDKAFFSNSGAEANEAMIKAARKYSQMKYGKDRTKILTLKNSFHGRTIATLEATGQDKFHQYFFPFTSGFDYFDINSMESVKEKVDRNTCSVMLELIQGESGVRPLDPDFVKDLESFCRENDLLLLVDEVQTGIGRTGKLFCYQNYDIHPDIVSMAKGLGGGVPIGGILCSKKTSSALQAGDHGSTFGANPLAATSAKTVLSIVDTPQFLADVQEKGRYFMEQLETIRSSSIKDVRGIGLMIGIEVDESEISDLIHACMERNLLVLKAGTNTIRLLPPLIITKDQIDSAVKTLKEVFENETPVENA